MRYPGDQDRRFIHRIDYDGYEIYYQLAFVMPGILPASAMSRKVTLDMPK